MKGIKKEKGVIKEKKFKIKNLFKSRIFFFVIGALIFGTIGVSASTLLSSSDVMYDNSSSGLSSTTVQDALDELYEQASSCPVCDSDGNCTVTCPSDKPNYVATSTGYKCVFSGTVYAFNTSGVTIGTSTLTDLGTSYATFASATASNSNSSGVIALKYTVKNNVLTEGYVCFLKGGTEYCLKGKDTNAWANNVAILNTAFPTCGASASGYIADCDGGSVFATASSNGVVDVLSFSSNWHCSSDSMGALCTG